MQCSARHQAAPGNYHGCLPLPPGLQSTVKTVLKQSHLVKPLIVVRPPGRPQWALEEEHLRRERAWRALESWDEPECKTDVHTKGSVVVWLKGWCKLCGREAPQAKLLFCTL